MSFVLTLVPTLALPSFLLSSCRPIPLVRFLREQAAALSDPSNKCRSHTNGGHKQPDTLGVFTCVADARFLLRALIVSHGYAPMLVVDVGSPPASDAGGITSGRGWDLRQSKEPQVGGNLDILRTAACCSAAPVPAGMTCSVYDS